MRYLALVICGLLVGCAPMQGGTPKAVHLSNERLIVTMSGGARCVAHRSQAQAVPDGWAGRLDACSVPLAYRVRLDPGTNPLRHVMVELFEGLGAGAVLVPLAEVELVTEGGRGYLFQTPPRPAPGDD